MPKNAEGRRFHHAAGPTKRGETKIDLVYGWDSVATGHTMRIRRATEETKSAPVRRASLLGGLIGSVYTVTIDNDSNRTVNVRAITPLGATRQALNVFDQYGIPKPKPVEATVSTAPRRLAAVAA